MARLNHNTGYEPNEWETVKTWFPRRRHIWGFRVLNIIDENTSSRHRLAPEDIVTYAMRVLAALGLAIIAAIVCLIVSVM